MSKLFGQEVYVITESSEFEPGDTVIVGDWAELTAALGKYSPMINSDVQVYHGFLNTAMGLPSNLRSRTPFVIMYDSADLSSAIVYESASETVEDLATEIEEVVNTGADYSIDVDIDNIYILYGYQLETCISVSEDELDEEQLGTCEAVCKDAMRGTQ